MQRGIAVAAVILLVSATVYVGYAIASSGGSSKKRVLDPVKQQAIGLHLDRAGALASNSLVLLGIAWTFLLKKEFRVKIQGFAAQTLFWCVSIGCVASYWCYTELHNRIVSEMFLYSSADLASKVVKSLEDSQLILFCVSTAELALLIWTAQKKEVA